MLVPGALLATLASPLSGALGARIGNKYPLAIGGFIGTLALVLAGFSHESVAEFVTYIALFQIGFGLAFAALPNLIIDAVPQAITGESMSLNTVISRVGASLGIQATATIVAGSAVAGSTLPTDRGYTIAFFTCAAVSMVGAIIALFIPRAARHSLPHDEPAGSAPSARMA
jgi:MFS family permease